MKTSPKRAPADGGLVKHALAYLATQQDVWATRTNSGLHMIKLPNGQKYKLKLAESGTPDITGYLANPKLGGDAPAIPFGIELKSKTGVLRVSQRAWHAKARLFGVRVCVARSIGEVKAFIEQLRGER